MHFFISCFDNCGGLIGAVVGASHLKKRNSASQKTEVNSVAWRKPFLYFILSHLVRKLTYFVSMMSLSAPVSVHGGLLTISRRCCGY